MVGEMVVLLAAAVQAVGALEQPTAPQPLAAQSTQAAAVVVAASPAGMAAPAAQAAQE